MSIMAHLTNVCMHCFILYIAEKDIKLTLNGRGVGVQPVRDFEFHGRTIPLFGSGVKVMVNYLVLQWSPYVCTLITFLYMLITQGSIYLRAYYCTLAHTFGD